MHDSHQIPLHHHQANAALAMSSSAANTAAATTTYHFSYSTYTNPSPAPFTKPNIVPTGAFSFGAVQSCTATATAQPSGAPVDLPSATAAACVISNDIAVSDHAFWDLYACCKGGKISATGKPLPCTGMCVLGEGQSWEEVGECLSKKNKFVVCKPAANEIGAVSASAKSSGSAAAKSSGAAAQSSGAAASAAASSNSKGAASSMYASHATFSKTGVVVFAMLAVASAAGMFL